MKYFILAVLASTALSGCVVVPVDAPRVGVSSSVYVGSPAVVVTPGYLRYYPRHRYYRGY